MIPQHLVPANPPKHYWQCFRQFDCILGLNKVITASSGVRFYAPSPVGVCRIDWAAQLTQTKQGGCLYEQPCSQSICGALMRFDPNGQRRKPVSRVDSAGPYLWQKPGIGILKSSKCNQTQALTTPVNLVGGVERLDHTDQFIGSMTAQ